jgi:hypothetical protein
MIHVHHMILAIDLKDKLEILDNITSNMQGYDLYILPLQTVILMESALVIK